MKTIILSSILFGAFSTVFAQNPKPIVANPPMPAIKEIALPANFQIEILKLQRQIQPDQLQEAERQQKAQSTEQNLEKQAQDKLQKDAVELNTKIEAARKELKLSDTTPFDQINLSFTVPSK